jgi:hypothetical protein
MCIKADSPLEPRQSEFATKAWREPWIRYRQLRPASFIQTGHYGQIGLLKPCLDQSPDRYTGMLTIGRAYCDRAHQPLEQWRKARSGELRGPVRGRWLRRRKQFARSAAGGAGPGIVAGQALRGLTQSGKKAGNADFLRFEFQLERTKQLRRLRPPCGRLGANFAVAPRLIGQPGRDAIEPGGRTWAAKGEIE